ncbi:MAG: PH domain-containing protein [Planctomycetaceae bacterium]|jgi:membrane protein YdbS with pleckstrin-like domain|nr:PH domain-containing protein [Planctomycetaceae bacterium]
MNPDDKFNDILDRDETILWSGSPNFTVFMLSGVPFLLVGMLWGFLDLGFITTITETRHGFDTRPPMFFIGPFFAIHLFPCWGSVLYMFWLYFSHANTAYAFSNKRILIRSGVWGVDYQIIDYDKIRDIQVNVNPVENWYGVGSILFNTGDVSVKGHPLLKRFSGIENPYDVFRQIKEVSLDVKTDLNYPNAKRPETNPGYRTEYKP